MIISWKVNVAVVSGLPAVSIVPELAARVSIAPPGSTDSIVYVPLLPESAALETIICIPASIPSATKELPLDLVMVSPVTPFSAHTKPPAYGTPPFAAPTLYDTPATNEPFSPVPS